MPNERYCSYDASGTHRHCHEEHPRVNPSGHLHHAEYWARGLCGLVALYDHKCEDHPAEAYWGLADVLRVSGHQHWYRPVKRRRTKQRAECMVSLSSKNGHLAIHVVTGVDVGDSTFKGPLCYVRGQFAGCKKTAAGTFNIRATFSQLCQTAWPSQNFCVARRIRMLKWRYTKIR